MLRVREATVEVYMQTTVSYTSLTTCSMKIFVAACIRGQLLTLGTVSVQKTSRLQSNMRRES